MYRFAYARIGARYALLLAALVGLLPSLGFWSWSGMETVPFVLAQVCVWMALTNVQQDKTRTALLCVSLVVCIFLRVDGFATRAARG